MLFFLNNTLISMDMKHAVIAKSSLTLSLHLYPIFSLLLVSYFSQCAAKQMQACNIHEASEISVPARRNSSVSCVSWLCGLQKYHVLIRKEMENAANAIGFATVTPTKEGTFHLSL